MVSDARNSDPKPGPAVTGHAGGLSPWTHTEAFLREQDGETVAQGATVAGPALAPVLPAPQGREASAADPGSGLIGAGAMLRGARVSLDLADLGQVMITVPPPALLHSGKTAGAVSEATQILHGEGEQANGGAADGAPRAVPGAFGASAPVRGFSLASGTRVQGYELIRRIGKGGMGEVWAAYDTRLGRQVAIKFLLSKASQKKEFRERFLAEARATAQFNHENIVIIHDVGEYAGMSYLVLEHLEGEPLSERLQDRKVSWLQAVQMTIPVVRALVEAHAAGIVHRDLKPANVFVLRSGGIKVLDFGLAKLFEGDGAAEAAAEAGSGDAQLQAQAVARALAGRESVSGDSSSAGASGGSGDSSSVGTSGGSGDSSSVGTSTQTGFTRTRGGSSRRRLHDSEQELTEAGAIMGTYAYMSPEQWGLGQVDPQTDLWAVGVILFSMVTGEHPFGSRATPVILKNIMDREAPVRSPREVAPEVPQPLAAVVGRCLQKDKLKRVASAAELLEALESLVAAGTGRVALRADQSPYQGLAPFTERDANRFFGRDAEIARFISKLKAWPTLAVIGPSGAGKSSFVRAGVIPTLRGTADDWDILVCRPGRDPFSAVAEGIVGAAEATELLDGKAAADAAQRQVALAQELRREPGLLGATLRNRARGQGRPVLLYVDQFEELYTLVEDPTVRDAFCAAVAGVAVDATTPVRVLLSMRSDFLERVSENRALLEAITRELTILQQPSATGLRDAILRPAALAGFAFDDESLVDEMVASLEGETAALPLLQFAAAKLWEERDLDRRLLTRAAYEKMGGVEGALLRHADAVVQGMAKADRLATRCLFQRLVTPEGTRAVLSMEELRGLFDDRRTADRLLDVLTEARLLVVQTLGDDEGDARVEIVHESLITRWQTLQRWLEEGHEDASMLAQLRDAARQWDARGRPAGLLWTGDAVDEARLWRRRSQARLTPLEEDFLGAAFRFADRALRRRRVLVVVAVVVMGLVTAGAVVAALSIREASQRAQREATRARAEASRATKEERRASAGERQLRKQMVLLAAETERARAAEALASKRLRDVQTSQAREQETQGHLKKSYEDLEEALEKAQRAEKRATTLRDEAQAAYERSRKAEQAERQARERLEVLLRKEREENQRLRKMRVRIYQHLPVMRQPMTGEEP